MDNLPRTITTSREQMERSARVMSRLTRRDISVYKLRSGAYVIGDSGVENLEGRKVYTAYYCRDITSED